MGTDKAIEAMCTYGTGLNSCPTYTPEYPGQKINVANVIEDTWGI